MSLQLSVIICSYNRAAYIGQALDSLYRQSADKSLFEVIVVDNNSTDGTTEVFTAWRQKHQAGNFHYTTETQQGASFARNKGAAMALSPWLCFMDDDAVASPNYVDHIIGHTELYPDRVGFGGRIIPRYIPSEPEWMSYYVSALVGNFDYSPRYIPFRKGDYPLESNMVVKKDVFDQVGGFSADQPGVVGNIRYGGEGKALYYAVQSLGHTIYYDPALVVEHVVEVAKLTRQYLYRVGSGVGRGERRRIAAGGQMAFILKFLEYLAKLGAAVIIGLTYAVQGHPAKMLPVIRYRMDAIRGYLE